MDIVYLNGEFLSADQAKVSVFDRGFLFADSVYEVIPYYQGKAFQLEQHLARLKLSLNSLKIKHDFDFAQITNSLVARNGGANQSVYLQVTRGAGKRRTHAIDETMQPTIFACSTAISNNYAGDVDEVVAIKVVVNEDLRWKRCDIKSTSLLPNILAMQQASQANAQESLLQRDGWVLEGASSNFFIVQNDLLIAPKSSHSILKGTTSELVQKIARENNITFTHAHIDYQQLTAADEVWITSSTRGLLPVVQVDDCSIGNGKAGAMWRRMYLLLSEHQEKLFQVC